MDAETINILSVAGGIGIFFVSLVVFGRITRLAPIPTLRFWWQVLRVLIVFFLLEYLFLFAILISGREFFFDVNTLVSQLFLWGSVFVLLCARIFHATTREMVSLLAARKEGQEQLRKEIAARQEEEEERLRIEGRIQQTQKMESLGILAGGIAHDFNNLLVGILGSAGLVLRDLPPESPVLEKVRDIQKAAMRAADLTNQMLAYSGRGRFIVQAIDLNHLVEEMGHLLDTVISKSSTVKLDLSPDEMMIEADTTQVRQVIMNLITNASDALEGKSGVIRVSTGLVSVDRDYLSTHALGGGVAEGRYVSLAVADTGCGMDQRTVVKIFDPFFTKKIAGRGLGLAAVLGIVRGHEGAIWVESEPDVGTTVRVLLPASGREPQSLVVEPGAVPDDWRGEGKVLVIDDEETVHTVARYTLEDAGFSVVTAEDGRDGVALFRADADGFVAVVLDLTMRHMSGEETFRELRAIRADVRVILMSGYGEQEVGKRFAGEGLAGFLQKPFRPADLIEALRVAVSGMG
jgi:signal transduction histidine kinase/CheY-like chemotaxis protein